MKIGIILQSNNPEHIWNTFRFGITSLKAGHGVTIFLMSEGSELETIADTENFDISRKVAEYQELKGNLYACGTCLEIRGKKESGVCRALPWTNYSRWLSNQIKYSCSDNGGGICLFPAGRTIKADRAGRGLVCTRHNSSRRATSTQSGSLWVGWR